MIRANSPLLRVSTFACAAAIVMIFACQPSQPEACEGTVIAGGHVLAQASKKVSGACYTRVYLDSVGTDTTGEATYTLDSVVTDSVVTDTTS